MKLAELVDKIELLVQSDPNINTFIFDDPEVVNEFADQSYPLLLYTPVQDTVDPRKEEQDYNIEFYLLHTYFQNDIKALRKKYSDMQTWGLQLIQELYDVDEVKDVDEVTIVRGTEQYNDNLAVVQFSFTVRVHDCMRLLRKPSNLTTTVVSSSQIDLSWNDNESNETNYEVSRSIDNSTWTTIATIAADSTTYSDTGIDPSTLYYYRIRATTSTNRSAFSNIDSATTTA